MKLYLYKLGMFFLFVFGISLFFTGCLFIYNDKVVLMDWEILTLNSSMIVFTLLFDYISLTFIGCVFFISSMVIYYSYSYMNLDFNFIRFYFLVMLFVISMMMMVISPNMISILLGWDGLGLVSYCLVIFFQNYKSYSAGMLTILTNRLGDVAILLAISWMLNFGSWYFMFYSLLMYNFGSFLLFLIILAGFTKSAQIPFSSWLPAAMAAPTPVSSLVHSSTLVTAGIYLLIRFYDIISSFNLNFFLFLSVLTMFMSGVGASLEFDLKKVIALSTLSQLGLMMSVLFMGFPMVAYFHLLTHAFFKSLLFLCAGLIIHCLGNSQDIRHMGSMINQLPYSSTCFCISNLSLCGVPFLSGFYSKDLIMELMMFSSFNFFIYILFMLSLGFTLMYSFRLIYYCFCLNLNLFCCQMYFEDDIMMKSLVFLSLLSVFGGSSLFWLIFDVPMIIFLSLNMKISILLVVFLGCFFSFLINSLNSVYFTLSRLYLIDYFFGSMWFLPSFSTWFFLGSFMWTSKNYYNNMDGGWGEFIFSKSFSLYFVYFSKYLNYYHFNNLKIFMFVFFIMCFIVLI